MYNLFYEKSIFLTIYLRMDDFMDNNLNDLEKLVSLSILYQLLKKGKITENEFKKICNSEKELLKSNQVEFSYYIDE